MVKSPISKPVQQGAAAARKCKNASSYVTFFEKGVLRRNAAYTVICSLPQGTQGGADRRLTERADVRLSESSLSTLQGILLYQLEHSLNRGVVQLLLILCGLKRSIWVGLKVRALLC
jgi:hypothetical protein